MFFKRFHRLWKMGFVSWRSRMVCANCGLQCCRAPSHADHARPTQSLRFYLIILVSITLGSLTAFLQITAKPRMLVAIVSKDKTAIIVVFVWATLAFAAVEALASYAQYMSEMLALDWRKALTRKVSELCATFWCVCVCVYCPDMAFFACACARVRVCT